MALASPRIRLAAGADAARPARFLARGLQMQLACCTGTRSRRIRVPQNPREYLVIVIAGLSFWSPG
jgi:hypothetical protein